MADLTIDRAQLEIIIKNDDSRKRIRELEDDTARLNKEMKSLEKQGKKDTAEWKEKEAAIKRNRLELDRLVNQIGLTGLTMKELQRRQQELNAIMKNMDPRLAEYKKLEAQLTAVSGRINELKGKSKDAGLNMGKMADGFNKYFGMVTAFAASFTGVIIGFKAAVNEFNEFEKKVDNLQALTGLVGEDLAYLTEEAKKLSVATIEGNVRITQSADAIVDAYTKVGSARPELLQNKEDLNAVTQEALILAAAADGELQPAVDALAGVLNQFNYDADESRRIINAIAAGSKAGAGEVPYLTVAIEKSGTVAKDAGIEIEQLIGIIETMAPRMSQPEIAGRSLKGILLDLQKGADETNPAIVGYTQAIENLAAKNLSAAELTKMFGDENITGAKILLNNRLETDKYTAAVTGTNVALEQAAINTDNNASKLDQARNKLSLITMELGERLAPVVTISTNGFTYLLKAIIGAPDFFKKYEISIIALTGAFLALQAAKLKFIATSIYEHLTLQTGIGLKIKDAVVMEALILKEQTLVIWKGKGTIASKAAATAQYAWNAAISANPIGALILGITALVTVIKYWDQNNAGAIAREKEKNEVLRISDEIITNLNTTLNEQRSQVEKINTLSVTEKQDLRDKINLSIEYTKAKLLELKAKEEDLLQDNTRLTAWQAIWNAVSSFGNVSVMVSRNVVDAVKNGAEAIDPIKDKISDVEQKLKQFESTASGLKEILDAESIADSIGTGSISELEEKIKNYGIAIRNVVIDSEDYIRISKKLKEANAQLKKSNDEANAGLKGNGGSTTTVVSDYRALANAISDAKTQLTDFITSGNLEQAMEVQKTIDLLTTAKERIDELIAAGGDISKVVSRTPISGLTGITSVTAQDAGDAGTMVPRSGATPDYEEDVSDFNKDFYLAQVQVASDAAFDIFASQQDARFNREIAMLDAQMEKELSNKNLTEEQKDKIRDKYAKREAKIKREQFQKQKIADTIQATINTALAVVKALPNVALAVAAGIAGVAQIAMIAAQPVPQFAAGKYPVMGASDGRIYNAEVVGTPSTGLYTRPSLVAERGAEIVIDAPTTSRMRANAPGLINAIYRMAGKVPQFAEGRYPDENQIPGVSGSYNAGMNGDDAKILANAINRLNSNLEKPIKAKVVYSDYQDVADKVESVDADSTM